MSTFFGENHEPVILEEILVVSDTVVFYLSNNRAEIVSFPLISSKNLLTYLHSSLPH